jgi:hypothetical protein
LRGTLTGLAFALVAFYFIAASAILFFIEAINFAYGLFAAANA